MKVPILKDKGSLLKISVRKYNPREGRGYRVYIVEKYKNPDWEHAREILAFDNKKDANDFKRLLSNIVNLKGKIRQRNP